MSPVLETTESNGEKEKPTLSTLFEKEDVRVSDLVGDLNRSEIRHGDRADAKVNTVRQRGGGRLSLDWYDWGVVALIVSSAVAGAACLLMGH